MSKFITIGIVALVATFSIARTYANTPSPMTSAEEEKYFVIITKKYPTSDERYQFAVAMNKTGAILSASAKDDPFMAGRIFSIIEPFLKSRNEKIKLCAEHALRAVKSGINLHMLTHPPDDASCEEVEQTMQKLKKANENLMESYSVFMRSCVPEHGKSTMGKNR